MTGKAGRAASGPCGCWEGSGGAGPGRPSPSVEMQMCGPDSAALTAPRVLSTHWVELALSCFCAQDGARAQGPMLLRGSSVASGSCRCSTSGLLAKTRVGCSTAPCLAWVWKIWRSRRGCPLPEALGPALPAAQNAFPPPSWQMPLLPVSTQKSPPPPPGSPPCPPPRLVRLPLWVLPNLAPPTLGLLCPGQQRAGPWGMFVE